jgi:hypothetical protein
VAAASWFRYAYLAYVSQPKSCRQLHRLVKRHRAWRIVEIGLSDVARSASLIEVAQRYADRQKVRHTGLDWFDARPLHLTPMSLKESYRILHATGATVRLVPGNPANSLTAAANAHQNTDLLLISSVVTDDDLKAAWFYVPRMLHQASMILRECQGPAAEPLFEWLTHTAIAEWAGRAGGRRAA